VFVQATVTEALFGGGVMEGYLAGWAVKILSQSMMGQASLRTLWRDRKHVSIAGKN